MRKFVLDQDEVVLLEEGHTRYFGSLEEVGNLEKLVLTSKRILGVWVKGQEEGVLEINASEIKRYRSFLCVDEFDSDDLHGVCLRVQSVNGIELFDVKNTVAWVEKIKEAFGDAETIEHAQKPKIADPISSAAKERRGSEMRIKKEEMIIVCTSCGKEYPSGSKFCPHCGTETSKPKVVEIEKTVEVVICRKCGAKMSAGSKFCPSCGTPVTEEEKKPVQEPKRDARENKIEKCPICGEILSFDAVSCPSCGHEIRGREATLSVAEFSKLISSIDDENKKIEAIKNYVIPNSKQDIMEFMVFATSNFDERIYLSNIQGENIACAWHTKIDQCYKKAMLMFTDQNDIRKIERLYNECVSKTTTTKKWKIGLIIAGIVLSALGFVLMSVAAGYTGSDGKTSLDWLLFLGSGVVGLGVVSFIFGIKKKKTNKQLEEEKIAKANRNKK